MKKNIAICVLLLSGIFPGCRTDKATPVKEVPVIPLCTAVETVPGEFVFNSNTVCYAGKEAEAAAAFLRKLFTIPAEFTPATGEKTPGGNSVVFTEAADLPAEGYRLTVTTGQIRVEAADKEGFFYAVQTLRQILPSAIESQTPVKGVKWSVPAVTITDSPRFAYRGLLLDVSRFFIPKDNVMRLLDAMALLKLNKLHLHLVDDNGWRLEIKKYPLLTEIGAWHVARDTDYAQRKNAGPGEKATVGGFYTQEDIKELVSYAAARQIEIIPEIEMPAHTNSSLAAYPWLACPVVKSPISVVPGMGADASKIVYCAGNEKVFTFLQDVIDEITELFPSDYIHLGGDEASKKYWKQCPLCQARMKAEHITDAEDLQGYFMQRMADYVHSKGKEVMGWDELTNSQIPEGAVIFGWRGLGEAGYQAGKQGHRFIMTPARKLYFIRYQGPQWFEPRTYFGNNTLEDVYTYEPVQPEWEPEAAANLMGVQGCLWNEFTDSSQKAEYLLFPRLVALSEIAWCEAGSKDWPDFLKRLDAFLPRLSSMGITYARSMYNLDHRITPSAEGLKAAIRCIRPDVDIRYTTDGSEPSLSSPLCPDTLTVTEALTVKTAAFAGGKQAGKTLTLPINWNKATNKPVIGNGNPDTYRLTNGLRGSDKHSDFEWCGWYGENASFVVDLQENMPVTRVVLGGITNYGMGVHLPKTIRLSVSDNDREYRDIGVIRHAPGEIFKEGIRIEDQVFDGLSATGRYLKVAFENPGPCPADHTRPGQNTWVHFDEIEVF